MEGPAKSPGPQGRAQMVSQKERGPDCSLTARPRRQEAELTVEFLGGARDSEEQETLLK